MKIRFFQLYAFLIFSALILSGCREVHPSGVLFKFQKKPYEQVWSSETLILTGQIFPQEAKIALKVLQQYGDTVSSSVWDSIQEHNTDSLFSIRLRLEPSLKVKDDRYTQNTDVEYGFGQSEEERKETINKFNFGLENNIWFIINGKKMYPLICHTEQNFGMDNGRTIWAAFKLTNEQKKFLITHNNTLFFQISSPLKCVAQLRWTGVTLKKCI